MDVHPKPIADSACRYDPAEYATIWGFWRNPCKIWQLLHEFLNEHEPEPNLAHVALARLEALGIIRAIITQNVDNLHQDAGSRRVIEYHGNLMSVSIHHHHHPTHMHTHTVFSSV